MPVPLSCVPLLVLSIGAVALTPNAAWPQSGFDCRHRVAKLPSASAEQWMQEGRHQEILARDLEYGGYADLAQGHHRCSMDAWRRAAEMGLAPAQYGYARRLMIDKAPLTPARIREAHYWLRLAAAADDEGAKTMLTWDVFRNLKE